MFKKAISIALVTIISITTALATYAKGTGFPDVKGHWAEATVQWAIDKGVVKGYEDGTFKPNQNVSEAEFLAMLIRSYKTDIAASQTGSWSDVYYDFAAKMNYPVIGEKEIGERGKPITRLRVAELISATQGVHFDGNDAIRFLYGNQLAGGTDPNKQTIASFNAESTLTRAEAVQFIKNLVEHGKGELLARPRESSDTSSLPDIPTSGDEKTTSKPSSAPSPAPSDSTMVYGELDLPYKTPDGWKPPVLKSTFTSDPAKNYEIFKNELGLGEGWYFSPYGGKEDTASISVTNGSLNQPRSTIVLHYWYGSKTEADVDNETPYIVREILRFYLPDTNDKLFHILDDGFMGKDINEYLNKKFVIDDHEVLIQTPPGGVQVYIGWKGKKLDLK
ncbi:S-layer homology domain-containing protein [Gordoniibacillus kamchatkensis]|uniref:S-layer homology domain-containing protein n=1 Tax=Gordoniibacillus kamchatkensis TaxID=1590651 RepID=UPI0006963F5F|nr:S-layer homology domain-containing protein [Paenibacillus sp. VKM B-2647]